MKHYEQLTSEQRYQISGLKKAGWKQARIAAPVAVEAECIAVRRGLGCRSRSGWWVRPSCGPRA